MGKFKTWITNISIIQQVVLAVLAGTVIGVAALHNNDSGNVPSTPSAPAESSPQTDTPKIEFKTITETKDVPYSTTTVDDSSLPKGQTEILTHGLNGVETITYKVTYTDGKETDRQKTSDNVTIAPTNEVIGNGTYVAPQPNCDPNYSGGCVPNVYPSDVDCAGGSGNGPYYVSGPVYVIGNDLYGLDRDGDGVACE